MKERILLIDDNDRLQQITRRLLTEGGYRVNSEENAEDALRLIHVNPPDLIISDAHLPGLSGLKLCELLKGDPRTVSIPLILLAQFGGDRDKVRGFKTGADDYLTKPFSDSELLARIEALIRRTRYGGNPTRQLEFKELRVDIDGRQVMLKNKSLKLRRKEFELLVLLMKNKNRLLSKEFIAEAIWKSESIVTNNTLSVHVRNLREQLGSYRDYLENLVGEGYRLCDD